MYNPKTYKVNEDKEVIKIIDNDELSPYTISTYQSVIKQFCNCIGKSYSEIITEIKDLQDDRIVGNKIVRYNPNDSLINEYIIQYMNCLTKNGNKNSTINLKTKQIITLLNKSNIITPKINFKTEQKQSKVKLITTEDIRFLLEPSTIHHKAMIGFMACTGARRYDVINNFKIEDFIEACSDYTNAIFLEDFLEDAPQDMIPYFEFIPNKTKKTGLPCKVCCTPETSNWILQSLKSRLKSIETHNKEKNDNLKLDEECPLFSSRKKNYIGKLGNNSISNIFYVKNKILKEHKEKRLYNKLINHEISKKEYKLQKECIPRFHPHGLRHRFISTIRAYTTNRDISLLMEGHASSITTDKFYVGESEELFNKETIKKTYMEVIPYLTFFYDVDPIKYMKEQKETNVLKNKVYSLERKIDSFEEMKEYLEKNSVLNNINGG